MDEGVPIFGSYWKMLTIIHTQVELEACMSNLMADVEGRPPSLPHEREIGSGPAALEETIYKSSYSKQGKKASNDSHSKLSRSGS